MTTRQETRHRARAASGTAPERERRPRRHALSLGLITLVYALGAPAQTSDIASRDWIELQSTNFIVVTDAREPEARAIIERLERFFQFAEIATNRSPRSDDLPRRLYYLESSDLQRALVPSTALAGLFVSSPIGPLMVARSGDDNAIIYHELIHLLMLSNSSVRYPLWYSEGFADYLAHADVREDRIIVGEAYEGALAKLAEAEQPPLRAVFHRSELDRRNVDEVEMFYAQSWGLVHMLLNSHRRGGADFTESLRRYLEEFDSGADVDAAFRESFGLTYEALEAELTRYYRRKRLPVSGYDVETSTFDLGYASRELSPNEALVSLAELVHFANPARSDLAEALLGADPVTETDALQARCLLGVIYATEGEQARAKALSDYDLGASEDSEALRQCGTHLLYLAVDARACEADVQASDQFADRALAALDRALALQPRSPVALYYRALTRLLKPDPQRPTLDYLLEASPWYPADTTLNFALAASLEQIDDERSAQYVERLQAFRHQSVRRDDLDALVAEYERPGERDVVMYPLEPVCGTSAR